jgi:rubrerythrin
MGLSREDVEAIGQATAIKVLEQLHRYSQKYEDPITIVGGLQDSMIEESTAAAWYRKRAADARKKNDPKNAELYEHIAQEEDQHHQEFKERVNALISLNFPISSGVREKEASYGFLQLNEVEYQEAVQSGRYPEPARYETLTAYFSEPHKADWKGLSLAEMFPTRYKDLLNRGVPDKLSALEVKTVIEEKRIPYSRGVETPVGRGQS